MTQRLRFIRLQENAEQRVTAEQHDHRCQNNINFCNHQHFPKPFRNPVILFRAEVLCGERRDRCREAVARGEHVAVDDGDGIKSGNSIDTERIDAGLDEQAADVENRLLDGGNGAEIDRFF